MTACSSIRIPLALLIACVAVVNSQTSCQAGCGVPENDDYIDQCQGENDLFNGMIGRNAIYCQKVSISNQCDLLGEFNASEVQPLTPTILADGSKMYTISLRNNVANQCYRKSELCVADIQCDENQLLFYDIIDHDVQGESTAAASNAPNTFWCSDLLAANQCLDYLHITRTSFNDDLCTCGRVGVNGQSFSNLGFSKTGLEFERISFTLRSNKDCRGFGVLATVVCIADPFAPARKKRAPAPSCSSTFISKQLIREHPPVQPPARFVVSARYYDNYFVKVIPQNQGFVYSNGVIRNCSNGVILMRGVSHLIRLTRQYAKQVKRVYKRTAPGVFHGYGVLLVLVRRNPYTRNVYYDASEYPPQFRLSGNDERVVNALLGSVAREQAMDSTFLPEVDEEDNQLLSTRVSPPQGIPLNLTRADYDELAMNNMDACQPIVRVAALAHSTVFRPTEKPPTTEPPTTTKPHPTFGPPGTKPPPIKYPPSTWPPTRGPPGTRPVIKTVNPSTDPTRQPIAYPRRPWIKRRNVN